MASKANALKDAMERAKQIAAKLQAQKAAGGAEAEDASASGETRKRVSKWEPAAEPEVKKSALANFTGMADPKVLAQQVAANLVAKATGSMGFELVEETTIPNNLVGLVIGRGGEMINKIQSETLAKVQVAPDPVPGSAPADAQRTVTISGSTQAVAKAKALLEEIKQNKKIPERLMVNAKPGEFSVEINIASGKVGLIIGKGGETIKSLQERAGAKMVLFQDGPYATAAEKPLRITGEQNAVMYGKQLVQDLLTSKEIEAATTSNYKEIKVPKDAVGMVIGAKGANVQKIQEDTGCRLQFKNETAPSAEFKMAMLTGTPQQLQAAEAKIMAIIEESKERGRGRGRQNWGPIPQPNNAGTDGVLEMNIDVPANKCGMVIGRGGETIRMIHDQSKANIEVNRDINQTSPTRTFRVKGTQDMINKALMIIREKTGDSSIVAVPQGGGEAPPPPQNPWGPPQQQQQPPYGSNQGGYGAPAQNPWGQQQPRAPYAGPPQQGPPQQEGSRRPPWENQYPAPQTSGQQPPWAGYGQAQPPARPPAQQPGSRNTGGFTFGQLAPAQPAPVQKDYSAEWAKYYEQQRQQQQQQQQQPPQQQQQQQQQQQYGQQPPAKPAYGQYEGYYQQQQQQPPAQPYGQSRYNPQTGTYGQPPAQPAQPPVSSAPEPQSKEVDDYQAKLQDFYKSLR